MASGPRVWAHVESRTLIMTTDFHVGLQFCGTQVSHEHEAACRQTNAYQRVMEVRAGLRHKHCVVAATLDEVVDSDVCHDLCTRHNLGVQLALELVYFLGPMHD